MIYDHLQNMGCTYGIQLPESLPWSEPEPEPEVYISLMTRGAGWIMDYGYPGFEIHRSNGFDGFDGSHGFDRSHGFMDQ